MVSFSGFCFHSIRGPLFSLAYTLALCRKRVQPALPLLCVLCALCVLCVKFFSSPPLYKPLLSEQTEVVKVRSFPRDSRIRSPQCPPLPLPLPTPKKSSARTGSPPPPPGKNGIPNSLSNPARPPNSSSKARPFPAACTSSI